MIVYRVIEDIYSYGKNGIERNEFQDYQKGMISFPSESYNDGLNTHNYKPNINYLHFFHFYEDALEYILGIPSMGWDGRYYIALYNIPENLLDKYRGFGLYPGGIHSDVPTLEYAIPFSELNNGFIYGKVIKYNHYKEDHSKEYKKYIEGEYNSYLEDLNEFNKQFIKSIINVEWK